MTTQRLHVWRQYFNRFAFVCGPPVVALDGSWVVNLNLAAYLSKQVLTKKEKAADTCQKHSGGSITLDECLD